MPVPERYSNVETTRNLVFIIFVFAIPLSIEPHLNRHVCAVIYHCGLTGIISVVGFTLYVCFENDRK